MNFVFHHILQQHDKPGPWSPFRDNSSLLKPVSKPADTFTAALNAALPSALFGNRTGVNDQASGGGTQAVEKVLKEYRLDNFLGKLVELGVTCVEDLADIDKEDLQKLGENVHVI